MSDQQWQVAGNAALAYETHLVPAIFATWAPRLLGSATPSVGERVLDVACGTGVVARLAAERVGPGGRVAGLDLNPGMLAVAGSRPVTGAPTGWVQASAGRMPFPDHSFQVVCCQAGLQFFPDRPAALAEMARVLAPGGRLAALVWRSIDHSPGFAALADALDRHIGPAAGAIMRAPFGLGDNHPCATCSPEPGSGTCGWTGNPGRSGSVRPASWSRPRWRAPPWPVRSAPPAPPTGPRSWPGPRPPWSGGGSPPGSPSRSAPC